MLSCAPQGRTMSQQRFRLQARYVLLTYAQCGDLDPWVVHDVITSFPAECLIGRETHADGGTHLHAFVDFGRKVDIRDPRRFDVEGFHPNIQPCGRTPQKMLDYAIKDGDVVAGGLSPILDNQIQELTLSGLESHMRQLWTSFGILFESWHHERFVATSTPCGPMPNGTIDPRLLNINTPHPFNLALREFQSSMNGYVTTCLELVSKGPPAPEGEFLGRARLTWW